MYTYEYPRPAVTTDCAIFHKTGETTEILLIERGNNPYKGCWALPGGFLNPDETLEQCAARELDEETGIKDIELTQLHAFSSLDRDPRGRTVSVVFYAVTESKPIAKAGDDAAKAKWFPIDELPPLAFDHKQVVELAIARIK